MPGGGSPEGETIQEETRWRNDSHGVKEEEKLILELRDICKEYIRGKCPFPSSHHISFSMEEGEYVAIIGPCRDSGKTTLMNIIGCLDQATSGTFFWMGKISKCNDDRMSE